MGVGVPHDQVPGLCGESSPIPLPAATMLPSESKATRAALSFGGICEAVEDRAAGDVPEDDRPSIAARDDAAAVGRDRQARDRVVVPRPGRLLTPGVEVPDVDELVMHRPWRRGGRRGRTPWEEVRLVDRSVSLLRAERSGAGPSSSPRESAPRPGSPTDRAGRRARSRRRRRGR